MNKHAIIDFDEEDEESYPEIDELYTNLSRNDEKEYRRNQIERQTKKAFRTPKKVFK